MELLDCFRGKHIVVGGPGVLSFIIAFPLHQILQLSISNLTIQNSFNLKLFISINQHRRRRGCCSPAWDWIYRSWCQLDDREYRMESAK
jgi:hypothetical protein